MKADTEQIVKITIGFVFLELAIHHQATKDMEAIGGNTATESRSRNRGCRRMAARRGCKDDEAFGKTIDAAFPLDRLWGA